MKQYVIKVGNIEGIIYQTHEGKDKYSFQLGGFYNWHKPLKWVVREAEAAMLAAIARRNQREFSKLRRAINKEMKTGIVLNAAKDAGLKVKKVALVKTQPEDYKGIPFLNDLGLAPTLGN